LRSLDSVWGIFLKHLSSLRDVDDDPSLQLEYPPWSQDEFDAFLAREFVHLRKGITRRDYAILWHVGWRQFINPGLAVRLEKISSAVMVPEQASMPATGNITRSLSTAPVETPRGLKGPSEDPLLERSVTKEQFANCLMMGRNNQDLRGRMAIQIAAHLAFEALGHGISWKEFYKQKDTSGDQILDIKRRVVMYDVTEGYCFGYLYDSTKQAYECVKKALMHVEFVKLTSSSLDDGASHMDNDGKKVKNLPKWQFAISRLPMNEWRELLALTEVSPLRRDKAKCMEIYTRCGGTPPLVASENDDNHHRVKRKLERRFGCGVDEVVERNCLTKEFLNQLMGIRTRYVKNQIDRLKAIERGDLDFIDKNVEFVRRCGGKTYSALRDLKDNS